MILRGSHLELWGIDRLSIGLCGELVYEERRVVLVLRTRG
jgi:hypothetical protein